MYALERLAQNTPDQRQTIVNVLCAYLRMPYQPPSEPPMNGTIATTRADDEPPASGMQAQAHDGEGAARWLEHEQQEQERQVRVTAQRIVANHLRPGDDLERPVETFWPKIALDLTGATLLDFNVSCCRIHTARFEGARFEGTAWFDGARFEAAAGFDGAQFSGHAGFDGAQFSGHAWFDGAQFSRAARFSPAQFKGHAWFVDAQFSGEAWFDGAQFKGEARFGRAQFSGAARFDGAQFSRAAGLYGARVRVDLSVNVRRSWPEAWVLTEPTAEGKGPFTGCGGPVGLPQWRP